MPLRLRISAFLYQNFARPFFFLFPPELVHVKMVAFGKFLGNFRIGKWLVAQGSSYQSPRNQITLAGVTFPNKVGLSAGFDYHADLTGILPSVGFGWHTIGTITLGSYRGNTPPRLLRLKKSKSLLVNKGLKNLGAKETIKKISGKNFSIPTGISIASTNKAFKNTAEQIADILKSFYLFEKSKVQHSYYELNISCPNTHGGEPFTNPERLDLLLSALDKLKLSRPVFIKMPIDQSDLESLAMLKTIDQYNIAGIIFGNLAKKKNNKAVHPEDKKVWSSHAGNLSGKPTWIRSNELVKLTRKHFKKRFVIIGTGGIFSAEDAATKIKNGADLIQLITGMIYQGPQLIGQINFKLSQL